MLSVVLVFVVVIAVSNIVVAVVVVYLCIADGLDMVGGEAGTRTEDCRHALLQCTAN